VAADSSLDNDSAADTKESLVIEQFRSFVEESFKEICGSRDTMTAAAFRANPIHGLSSTDLDKVWDLSDLDGNGTFSLDEFTLAFDLT
jgi:hypothetical protein